MFHVEHLQMEDLSDNEFLDAAASMGVPLSEAQLGQFTAYEALLADWSTRVRLVSTGDRFRLRQMHLLDCLSALPHLGPEPCRLLDLGSGAGLPGIVIRIARPDVATVLLESARMKALFLRHVQSELSLEGLAVVHGRAESKEVLQEHGERYDWISVRAVGGLQKIWDLSRPLLKPTGRMLAYKGPDRVEGVGDDLDGGLDIKNIDVRVPGLGRERRLISVGA
jgi:16S rRNA (guanine527-N7)-methyltransferase